MQNNSMFPIKHVSSLDLLDGTPENPQEHCHKSRRTLMSPLEWQTALCTRNQLEIKHKSPVLAPEPSDVPHHTGQVA